VFQSSCWGASEEFSQDWKRTARGGRDQNLGGKKPYLRPPVFGESDEKKKKLGVCAKCVKIEGWHLSLTSCVRERRRRREGEEGAINLFGGKREESRP